MYDINISKKTAVLFKNPEQGFYREIIPSCSYNAGIETFFMNVSMKSKNNE